MTPIPFWGLLLGPATNVTKLDLEFFVGIHVTVQLEPGANPTVFEFTTPA
jgi:hypothetical protein